MVALIGMILALVFVLVAFIGPWWGGTDDSMGTEMESYFHLTEVKGKVGGVEMTQKYSDMEDSDAKSLFDTIYIMVILTIIFAVLATIGIAGMFFNFGPLKTMKMLALAFGALTFILAFISALYFMSAFPGAIESIDGFWIEKAGPAYGWYILIIGAILALVSTLFIFKEKATA